MKPTSAEIVRFLRQPEAYPDATARVDVVETHMSFVFLTERRAYKLKKPVRFDGLDFLTTERRRRCCEAELRLNRRLARRVYLGIAALRQDRTGALRLGGTGGRVVDWLVVMRRLPADRMLDAALARPSLERAEVLPVARHLAAFYAHAPSVAVSPRSYRRRLRAGVLRDLRELVRPEFELDRARIAAVAEDLLRFLDAGRALLDARVRAGRIVEGHGDLRPEHLYLGPGPAIIDCLEFSRPLRVLDPADELAFLALECERLGRAEIGPCFLEAYCDATGDEPPRSLLRFHRSYRALRRATLAAWHVTDPDVRDPARWRERARHYLALADPPADQDAVSLTPSAAS